MFQQRRNRHARMCQRENSTDSESTALVFDYAFYCAQSHVLFEERGTGESTFFALLVECWTSVVRLPTHSDLGIPCMVR